MAVAITNGSKLDRLSMARFAAPINAGLPSSVKGIPASPQASSILQRRASRSKFALPESLTDTRLGAVGGFQRESNLDQRPAM